MVAILSATEEVNLLNQTSIVPNVQKTGFMITVINALILISKPLQAPDNISYFKK